MKGVDGHIHIGANFLGEDYKAWENFFSIYSECEELFYKMSNESGQIPRRTISEVAAISNDTLLDVPMIKITTKNELNRIIERMNSRYHRGLNFSHMTVGEIQTIEYRIPNGTIDIEILRENIYLIGKLLTVSKQMSENPEYKIKEFELLMSHDLTEREKEEVLLSLLFNDEKERSIYRNRWESIKDNKIFEEVKSPTPTFERGNYYMRDEVRAIFVQTTANDRNEFIKMLEREIIGIQQIYSNVHPEY